MNAKSLGNSVTVTLDVPNFRIVRRVNGSILDFVKLILPPSDATMDI